MAIFLLIVGLISYYFAIYILLRFTIKVINFKRRKLAFGIGLGIFSIPMFCIIDYLHRGIAFVEVMAIAGYSLTAFLLYYCFSIALWICGMWLYRLIKKEKVVVYSKLTVLVGCIMSLVVCVIGIICAQIPEITRKELNFNLEEDLKVVAVSDLHYASTGSPLSLERMVEKINKEKPDVVVLVGDVFDNKIKRINRQHFVSVMEKLESKYGVFAVIGNHELMQNTIKEISLFYKNTNIKLLTDEEVIIRDELRLVGRIDYKAGRKPLNEIVSESNLPLIVLDHQPQFYKDAQEVGANLQISGHTHNGQIFPGDLAVLLLNQINYGSPSNGFHKYDSFNLAITRGYGTWGFPMRLSGSSQVLVFNLT